MCRHDINLAIFVDISERDKVAALKRIQIYYIVIFLFAIAFFTLGGAGNVYINNEKEWDISAWYQVYVGAFIAGGMVNTSEHTGILEIKFNYGLKMLYISLYIYPIR